MEFVDNLVFELEAWVGLTKGIHGNIQKENMQAQGLMDNQINNLKLTNEKLSTLVLTLDMIVFELEKSNEIKGGKDEL